MNQPVVEKRFRFIPYRKADVIEMILKDDLLSEQQDKFRELCYMLSCVFHFEFHKIIESLKDSYAPIDPDSDTRFINNGGSNNADSHSDFVNVLGTLLEKANYEQVSEEDLNQALNESSLFKIRLQVEFEDFSEVLLFCRGEAVREETVSKWFGLSSKTISFTNYERVVVYLRFREEENTNNQQLPGCKPGSTLLKLFQNVPKADLEMLFPNTRVRMRPLDKVMIGVPALVSGAVVLTTKLGASLVIVASIAGFWLGLRSEPVELNKTAMMALLAGLVALGGYLWKQFNTFKNRKLQFMQALTQNLYFKNLDNNAGVFHRLGNDAEEEECKEAILAYYFLYLSDRPLSRIELDEKIENWFATKWGCVIDFEIDDALEKLEELKMVNESDGMLTTIPIPQAIKCLDQRWDNYFIPE